ncbi:MAG: DNA polymerase III subunit delta' [SAR324 cluster bacterium]|nr:DNA polymerase III subunit delta' [SAR324 cluster bacterium]
MGFERIKGQETAVERLRAVIAHERVPSAMLFLGPHGVGKSTVALELAKALNCLEAPGEGCGACPSCRKIAAGVHGDMDTIAPDGQFIKIDQVRALADRLGLIPFDARKRVIVLREAERLNPAAANAFLKTLEEPPEDTLLVLTATSASLLLETIVSRCMPLRFTPLGAETVRAILVEEGKLSEAELDFAVRHSQGRIRAELLRGAGRLMVLRDELLHALEAMDRLTFDRVSEHVQKWSGADEWAFVLECMETWYHDLGLLGAGGPEERLVNGDRAEALRRWGRRVPPARAEACYREVLSARDGMLLNVIRPLALESLWISLRQIALQPEYP